MAKEEVEVDTDAPRRVVLLETSPVRADESMRNGRRSVCVVGGGPAGLACCKALCDADLSVTLVQESRGLGGKMCTKFVNGKEDPTLHFDMGVQVLRPDGALKRALEGAVEPWPREGRLKRLHCSGGWDHCKVSRAESVSSDGFVVGVPSMSALGRHLAEQCTNLTIHLDRTAHVKGKNAISKQWQVEWERKEATGGQLRYRPELADVPAEVGRGEFDAVVLAFEANKIIRGCKSGYKMTQPSATPRIRKAVAPVRTSQNWNIMVAFDRELPMPWDAAFLEGHRSLSWVAVDSSKPQRARLPQCFMAFSTQEWADWTQWSKRDAERALCAELLLLLEQVLGQRPPEPCFLLGGRWGNNTEVLLSGERGCGHFPQRALGAQQGAREPVWDADSAMGATGDWARGFSVSDAYAAGLELAAAILADDQQDRIKGA